MDAAMGDSATKTIAGDAFDEQGRVIHGTDTAPGAGSDTIATVSKVYDDVAHTVTSRHSSSAADVQGSTEILKYDADGLLLSIDLLIDAAMESETTTYANLATETACP